MLAHNNVKYMEHCKNAHHVSEFFTELLYRKETVVLNYFQTHDINEKWDNVDGLYKSKKLLNKVNPAIENKIIKIENYIKAIKYANSGIKYYKEYLSKYFDLNNIKETGEQKSIMKLIDEINGLEQKNNNIMKYLRCNDIDKPDDLFCDILKKVIIF